MIISKRDLFLLADSVAREKNIPLETVYTSLENAIQKMAENYYGIEKDIRVHIDRKTGDINLARYRHIIEEVENIHTEITEEETKHLHSGEIQEGYWVELLPMNFFGRIAARIAKQTLIQDIKVAESEQQYAYFNDKVGQIVSGTVKRFEGKNIVLDSGGFDVTLRAQDQIPRENYRRGDKVRGYLQEVRKSPFNTQVYVSRVASEFLSELLREEIPEIERNVIEIINVARDPGSRAKIAVISHDPGIDPVGATIGSKGSRIQSIVNELSGERIDVIHYIDDLPLFVIRALVPAKVSKVVLDEETDKISVVVPDDELSMAIGRRGQNVRLASQLTGWSIDIITEKDEKRIRKEEYTKYIKIFSEALDVDDMIARFLITEGFRSIEDISKVSLEELINIEGFDEDLAKELIHRAQQYMEKHPEEPEKPVESIETDTKISQTENEKIENV